MRTRLRKLALFPAAMVAGWAHGVDAATLEGSVTGTSDYVFRGLSQSRGAAMQSALRWSGTSTYASLWASNVDFGPASDARIELDATVGTRIPLGPHFLVDAALTRFSYPDTHARTHYSEAQLMFEVDERLWLTVAHAPDVFASGAAGTYVQVGRRWPLGRVWRVEASAGHYALAARAGADYTHAQWTLGWRPRQAIDLYLAAHATRGGHHAYDGIDGLRLEAGLSFRY